MVITLAEAKEYLRIDSDFEDTLITTLINSAEKLCADVARLDVETLASKGEVAKVAVLFTVAQMYENRVGAGYENLTSTLRSLLFSIREV